MVRNKSVKNPVRIGVNLSSDALHAVSMPRRVAENWTLLSPLQDAMSLKQNAT